MSELGWLGGRGLYIYIYIYININIHMYMYKYIYKYKSEVGGFIRQAPPPVTGKSFRVVPCVRTCVRAVLGLVRFQPNRVSCSFPFPLWPGRPFPFPFYPASFSLFPCASICSLFPCEHHEEMDSNEIK